MITKDITTVTAPAVIIHGVNCQREMHSGVAKSLSSKWPQVKEKYLALSKNDMKIGTILPVCLSENLYVLNCFTQLNYGYDNATYASVEAIRDCLIAAAKFCLAVKINALYAPRIGCGLGGLDWEADVSPLFKALEDNYQNIKVTICDINQ